MKALTQDRYGTPDVLVLSDVAAPEPGEGEVLVRVRAAGVDAGVWHVVAGMPYAVRALGFGMRAPKKPTPRPRPRRRRRGRRSRRHPVRRRRRGARHRARARFAELAVALERKLVHKPAALTFEQAAALPVSGITAVEAVRKAGGHRRAARARHRRRRRRGLVRRADRQGGRRARHRRLVAPRAHRRRARARRRRGRSTAPSRRSTPAGRSTTSSSTPPAVGRWGCCVARMTPQGHARHRRRRGRRQGARRLRAPAARARWPRCSWARPTAPSPRTSGSPSSRSSSRSSRAARSCRYVGRAYPLASGADAVRDLHDGKAQGKLVLTV